jgi:hypothetical protein
MQQKKLNLNNQKQGVNNMVWAAVAKAAVKGLSKVAKARKASKATGGSAKSPSLKENVVKGVKEDAGRISKAKTSTAKGAAKKAVEGGASRAKERMVKRAGAVGAAGGAGYAAGKAMSGGSPAKSSSGPSGRADQIPGQTSPGKRGLKTSSKIQDSSRGSHMDRVKSFAKSGGVFRGSEGTASPKKRRR